MVALLAACPPPGGGGTPTTYTTTVSGKVTTPAGNPIATARVWASTDLATKVTVGTDGSYNLKVVDHPGTFTVSADYTATDGNYKAAAPQSVTTTVTAHTQDIALKYGYTITVSGRVIDVSGTAVTINGATVTARVEDRVVRSTTSSGTDAAGNPAGNYSITFDHPGAFRVTASHMGMSESNTYTGETGAPITGSRAALIFR